MTLEQLAIDVLGLSARERATLARQLIASLEDDASADVDALWADEAEHRLRQLTDGSARARPAAEGNKCQRSRCSTESS